MSEITTAIAEAIRTRATSATLGTYFLFWLAYHWQGLYITLFVNQDLIYGQHGLLKNEYVDRYYFGANSWHDWNFYLGFAVPALLTYLFIWWMPYILMKSYQKEQWFRIEKRLIKIGEEKRIQEDRKELALETTEAINQELQASKAEKIAQELDPKIIWRNEYDKLDNQEVIYFGEVLTCVYKYRGQVYVSGPYNDSLPDFVLSPNALRIADSMELVKIVSDGEMIELTPKGKFFASQFNGEIL